MHEVKTGGYLIARTETTYAQWIEFLDALEPSERAKHTPRIEVHPSVFNPGTVVLARTASGWELEFDPGNSPYRARAGEAIAYRDRAARRVQDWSRMPVSGIAPGSAIAYAAWLDRTGRVRRARLCDEREWERAARGEDGRSYPHGNTFARDDINIDVTYGQREGGFGMDEVGAHPASTSPFGLLDMAGNVWEMTRSTNGVDFVMRGGGFYNDARSAHLANRGPITPSYAHLHLGLRICADV